MWTNYVNHPQVHGTGSESGQDQLMNHPKITGSHPTAPEDQLVIHLLLGSEIK